MLQLWVDGRWHLQGRFKSWTEVTRDRARWKRARCVLTVAHKRVLRESKVTEIPTSCKCKGTEVHRGWSQPDNKGDKETEHPRQKPEQTGREMTMMKWQGSGCPNSRNQEKEITNSTTFLYKVVMYLSSYEKLTWMALTISFKLRNLQFRKLSRN